MGREKESRLELRAGVAGAPTQKRLRRGAPIASSDVVRHRMQNTPQRDTPVELALRACLRRLGLRYSVHRQIVPEVRRQADVVFASARVAVFVDGCFWHGCPLHGTWPKANAVWWRNKIETNRTRDADTDSRLFRA